MTVMPMLPPTISPAAPLSAEAGTSEGADTFFALLTGLIAESAHVDGPTSTGSALVDAVESAQGDATPEAADELSDPQPPGDSGSHQSGIGSLAAFPMIAYAVPVSIPLTLTGLAAPVTAETAGTPGAAGPPGAAGTPGAVEAPGEVVPEVGALPASGTDDAPRSSLAAPHAPALAGSAPTASAVPVPANGASASDHNDPAPAPAPVISPTTAPVTAPAAASAAAAGAGSDLGPTAPAAPVTAANPAPVTAPITATVATALAGAPAAASPNPVTTQIVDQIAQLVTSSNGSNRVTLKLQPESLGDVRVVVTVRDGAVHVQLSAHDAAARTLLDDSPALRRALEQLGAGDARITVRDLGANPSTSQTGAQLAATADDGANDGSSDQFGNNTNDSTNDRARTPGHITAMDGTDATTTSSQHTQSASSHRSSGVDLTM